MNNTMSPTQIQNMKNIGVSNKGINYIQNYIQDVMDLSKFENPRVFYIKLVSMLFIAIIMLITYFTGSKYYSLVALIAPFFLFVENFTSYFSKNVWKKDDMTISSKNIRRFLSVDLQILKPGAFRRFTVLLSFIVIFVSLLILGSIIEIATFVILCLVMGFISYHKYEKYRKILVDRLNKHAESVRSTQVVNID